MQEQELDNRIVAKSNSTAMNLAVIVSTSSSFVIFRLRREVSGYSKSQAESLDVQGNLT